MSKLQRIIIEFDGCNLRGVEEEQTLLEGRIIQKNQVFAERFLDAFRIAKLIRRRHVAFQFLTKGFGCPLIRK